MRRKRDIYFTYKITNTVTSESYVGITGEGVHSRWMRHVRTALVEMAQTKLARAIRKYGASAFTIEPIAMARGRDNALALEILMIDQEGTYHANGGYNLTLGGDGFSVPQNDQRRQQVSQLMKGRRQSEETRRRRSAAAKIRWQDPEYKEAVRKQLSIVNTGKKASKETIRRQSEGLKRAYQQDPTFAARVSAAHKGKKRSAETCRKISAAVSEAYRRDPAYGAKISRAKAGKCLTDSHRAALSIGHKRPWQDPKYRERMTGVVRENLKKARLAVRKSAISESSILTTTQEPTDVEQR